MSDSLAESALEVARAGWPVFPCQPHGKAPITPHGFLDATTNEPQIQEWWTWSPQANIAMPTGSRTFDVLDIDVRESGSGMATFNYLKETGLLSGAMRLVRTPSAGLHVYFAGTEQPCASLKGLFIDLKARGGYILLPPSHVVTDQYSGSYLELDRRDDGRPLDWSAVRRLLEPPPALSDRGHHKPNGSLGSLARWLKSQPTGTRNQSLFWAACRALEGGHTDLDEIVEAAEITGLPLDEINRTVESALTHIQGVRS